MDFRLGLLYNMVELGSNCLFSNYWCFMIETKELLTRSVAEIIHSDHLSQRIAKGEKLRLKLGIDPTSPDIHLGFAVVLWKLRQFQDLGHKVVVIIGDTTAQVGDPTGKNVTRPVLTSQDVKSNAKTYLQQIGKILDLDTAEVRWNSEWFQDFTLNDVVTLLGQFTAAQILERDDFSKRLREGNDISMYELLYPLMQAYDSVMVRADVEFGGTDQRFNILAGRDLQRKMGQEPQDMLLVPLLVGVDGVKKMSKSLGNYIGITEPAPDMYGKLMSIPDYLIMPYFELATLLPQSAISLIRHELADELTNPRDVKMQLAREITALYHGVWRSAAAEEAFVTQFQKGRLPDNMNEKKMKPSYKTLVLALIDTGLVSSNSEARRLVDQGGVRVNEKVINDPLAPVKLKKGMIIQVGKRKYVKVK